MLISILKLKISLRKSGISQILISGTCSMWFQQSAAHATGKVAAEFRIVWVVHILHCSYILLLLVSWPLSLFFPLPKKKDYFASCNVFANRRKAAINRGSALCVNDAHTVRK